jgi:acyl dehydratase
MLYFEDIAVGSTRNSGAIELTEAQIIDFARHWDPLPFHTDPNAARQSPLGGLVAAGCHVFCVATWLAHQFKPLALIAGLKQELEFPNPARPGDRLSMTSECVAKRISNSRPDRGILTFQCLVTTQAGTPVLRMTSTLMVARRPIVEPVD